MKNYYHILQVNRFASTAEIKQAYRRLALLYHPDRSPGHANTHQRFVEIGEAYAVLSDPDKRKHYDAHLFAPPLPPPPVRNEPRIDPNFVRREQPMSRLDKQIFFGGLFGFVSLLLGALWVFMVTRPERHDPDKLTDWTIREPNGHARHLSHREFDSLLQVYNLDPGEVSDLIDSLRHGRD